MYNMSVCNKISRNIFSIKDFHRVIKRERFLADRNNHKFSLILFDVQIPNKRKTRIEDLKDILDTRVRLSDMIGWFDKRSVAVLMVDTSIKGARKLAHEICMSLAAFPHIPPCTVYTYPSLKWLDGENFTKPSCPKENVYVKFADGYKIPFWKRAIDIFGSLIGLIILSPLFVIVAILIKSVSPGSVLFYQKRVGRFRKTFTFLKFRTMKVNNDSNVHSLYLKDLINGDSHGDKPMEKLANDSRIIPFGKILRNTCIDELPQLINVLRGEMSLVGPRPCIPYESEEYLLWHTRRFDITPGMTGLWQINGKNRTTFKEMVRFDIKYSKECSFWLDMIILLKTPFVILCQMFGSSEKVCGHRSHERNKERVNNNEMLETV